MVHTHKMVNGKPVALTSAEAAALAARDTAWAAGEPHRQAEKDRYGGLTTDAAVLDMADRLANATATQIDTWFSNNVTSPAQAIAVLKTVCKILAVKLTPRGLG